MEKKSKKRLKEFWEREKFVIGIISGMALTIMVLVVSLFISLLHLSIVGC